MRLRSTTGFAAGCAFAAVLSIVACDRGDVGRDARDNAAPGANANDKNAPVTLVGCLQKQEGITGDYLLSDANRQSGAIGTSGASDTVGREQMHAAAHAYRLSGDDDKFKDLVGKRVRVSGTIAERSDLAKNNDRRADEDKRPAGTAGATADKDRPKVDEDDLAKVDVKTIDKVADACGSADKSK